MKTLKVWCPRSKGAHLLARHEVTPAGPRVIANLAAPGRNGFDLAEQVFTLGDLIDGEDGLLIVLTVHVGCRCGRRFLLDVAPLLKGESVTLRPYGMDAADERTYGLNPDRLR